MFALCCVNQTFDSLKKSCVVVLKKYSFHNHATMDMTKVMRCFAFDVTEKSNNPKNCFKM